MSGSEHNCIGSESRCRGVRITVQPVYMADQSDPDASRHVFAYRIEISNEGKARIKLLTRRWLIVDAHGREEVVEGDGVVGRQPELEPGTSFVYSSYCPLRTPWGTMEGAYGMVGADGEAFEAPIRRFYLVAPREQSSPAQA